jgi:NDP-sugar pyrophosphorylase family protein
MAGRGSRFSMVGYNDPKPLLTVNGNPMVVEAVRCLPQSARTIFVGLKEHFKQYPIEHTIKKYISNSEFHLIDETTNGQATTTMIALNSCNISNETPILVSACDNGAYYDTDKYDELIRDPTVDVVVWSFTNNPTSKLYPHMYAWLDVDSDNNIRRVSVKKPFTDRPNVHCIIGTMYFRNAKLYRDGYKHITTQGIKTNNEYYIDNMLDYLIDSGYKVKVFPVDYYLCWGTPNDYKSYLYWQEFFSQCWWHPYRMTNQSTLFVSHRINTIRELINTPIHMGIEIDLRDSNGKILVTHDPFTIGPEFNDFIKHFKHKFIILNIKSEGIEYSIRETLRKNRITNYFFLDSSFPMIYKLSQIGEHNSAIRISEYESIETVLNMKNLAKWVWVDCFTKLPIDKQKYDLLKSNGFSLCLVSPELQKHEDDIAEYSNTLKHQNMPFDMICTKIKNVKKW